MAKIQSVHIPAQIRNQIKNGALDFWQEKVGTTTTVNTATGTTTRFADLFLSQSSGTTVKNYSTVRSTDVPTLVQSGFQSTYSYLFTMITGISSLDPSDFVLPCNYRMEGFDYEKLHSKVVTFGFWLKASVPGTYAFALRNSAADRSYVTSFVVSGTGWEFKSITVTLDSTGTWLFDSGVGITIFIGGISGTTFAAPSLNSWQAGNYFTVTGGTNWQATSGATLQVAQVSMVEGSLGLGPQGFARACGDVSQELVACLRYYEKSYDIESAPAAVSNNGQSYSRSNATNGSMCTFYSGRKRAAPTIVLYSPATGASGNVRSTGDVAATATDIGQTSFDVNVGGLGSNVPWSYQWTADARL